MSQYFTYGKQFNTLFIKDSGTSPPHGMRTCFFVYVCRITRIFDIKQDDFDIKLKPSNSPFWRLGFKYSKTDDFPPIIEGRYPDENIVHIEVCIGTKDGPNGTWQNPGQFWFQSRNAGDITSQNGMCILETYNGEEISITTNSRNDGSQLHFIMKITGTVVVEKLFTLRNKNSCQLSAWADSAGFMLLTDIKVIHKGGNNVISREG